MIKEIKDIELINKFLKYFDVSISEIGVYSHYDFYYVDGEPVAFLSYDLIYDRIEIEYIYVLDKYRNNGIASYLMDNLLEIAYTNHCNNITLEVRKSNISAIKFYQKHNFKEVAYREKYYGNEDGILMIRELV